MSCHFGKSGLEAVAKGCPNLKRFSVEKSDYVLDKGVVAFDKAAFFFETLILEECHTVTQLSIFELLVNCGVSRCNSLKSLSARNCSEFGNYRITYNGFTSLIQNSEDGLMKVDLSGCLSITDKVVSEILLAHGVTLEVLNLDAYYVLDKGVVAFAKAMLSFETLILEECHTITQLSIFELLVNRGTLKALSLTNCSEIKDLPMMISLGVSRGQLYHQFHNVVLNGLHRITNSGFKSLIQNSKASLMMVDLSGCLSITDKLRTLAGAGDSTDIRDQLSVLFRREANEESKKMHDYRRLSDELRESVRMRDAYIEEFQRLQMMKL
ncbi:EIN3-binding F-box protein 1-like protein [Tanacetum coccineum]